MFGKSSRLYLQVVVFLRFSFILFLQSSQFFAQLLNVGFTVDHGLLKLAILALEPFHSLLEPLFVLIELSKQLYLALNLPFPLILFVL